MLYCTPPPRCISWCPVESRNLGPAAVTSGQASIAASEATCASTLRQRPRLTPGTAVRAAPGPVLGQGGGCHEQPASDWTFRRRDDCAYAEGGVAHRSPHRSGRERGGRYADTKACASGRPPPRPCLCSRRRQRVEHSAGSSVATSAGAGGRRHERDYASWRRRMSPGGRSGARRGPPDRRCTGSVRATLSAERLACPRQDVLPASFRSGRAAVSVGQAQPPGADRLARSGSPFPSAAHGGGQPRQTRRQPRPCWVVVSSIAR